MTLKWALVKVRPFELLTREEADYVRSLMVRETYRPGDTLNLGCEPGGWWVVEKGLMKAYTIAPDGSALTYAFLGPGDSFGETNILTGHWVRAIVEALEPTEVLHLHPRKFEALLKEQPDFALALLRVLAEQIRESQERVYHLSRLKISHRIAHALIGLAQQIGVSVDEGLEVRLTHQEIADYVGASRETVSRTLSRWERKGWISTHRKSLIIKNLDPFLIMTNRIREVA